MKVDCKNQPVANRTLHLSESRVVSEREKGQIQVDYPGSIDLHGSWSHRTFSNLKT